MHTTRKSYIRFSTNGFVLSLRERIHFYARIREIICIQTTTSEIMIDRQPRLPPIRAAIILLMLLIVGCSPATTPPAEITQGSSKEAVIRFYGEPDRTQEYIIPDGPFFGPQEGLINFVPPGTLMEEWVYEVEDEELYIWFTGDSDESRENWLVLDLGRYPTGAVY